MPTKCHFPFWDLACTACAFVPEARKSTHFHGFLGEKLQQELSEGHENWHEGGDGRCQRNDIFRCGIARAEGAYFCAKHTNSLIFMVLGGKVAARIVGGS